MNSIIKSLAEIPVALHSITSYADALTSAIRRMGPITIGTDPHAPNKGPRLVFSEVPNSHLVDYVHTGKHTMVYELEGTGKTYEIAITPMKATHGGAK